MVEEMGMVATAVAKEMPRDGSAQKRKAGGREWATLLTVAAQEDHGGIARRGRARKRRRPLPLSI